MQAMVLFILSFRILAPHIQKLQHGYEMQGMYMAYTNTLKFQTHFKRSQR